jgi:hypothetical protein
LKKKFYEIWGIGERPPPTIYKKLEKYALWLYDWGVWSS